MRSDLLGDALRLCESLQREQQADPRLRIEVARTKGMLARIHVELGNHETAEAKAREATQDLTRLVAAGRGSLSARFCLADAHETLGTSRDGLGNPDPEQRRQRPQRAAGP